MKISQIRVKKFEDTKTKLVGYVSITLDDWIAIHDIKLLIADKRFIAMPSRADSKNTFRDIVHPINADMRNLLEKLLFDAYDRVQEKRYFQLKEGCNKDILDLTIDDYELI